MNFKEFLMMEDKQDLGKKIGPILDALQGLMANAGKKNQATITATENIISMIQSVANNPIYDESIPYLQKFGDIGVYISKSLYGEIDEDIPSVLQKSIASIQKMVEKLGVPINSLGVDDATKDKDSQSTSALQNQTKGKGKATVPPSDNKVVEPTGPGTSQQDSNPPLGGSTGMLNNF